MNTDPRLQAAADYLQGARQRPIDHMPPSRLMAELAETRRQLGILLTVISEQGAQREEVGS